MARRRLRHARGLTLEHGNFTRAPIPRCHAIVTTLALHHIRSAAAKRHFYRRCFRALRRGGVLATGDCFVADDPSLTRRYLRTWQAHLAKTYRRREARRFFAAWRREDTYFPLTHELAMLTATGFRADVPWRHPPFAVLLGRKPIS